jgi:SAM-dependent methyltransferase
MITVEAERDIAYESEDHLFPWGTRRDNSRNWRFNLRLNNLFPRRIIRILDIGCAGGGFVNDCIDDGHLAVGLEGSDYSKKANRASWPLIPNNLFTCDVSRTFQVLRDGQPLRFDVVTSWEVLEHIHTQDLPALLRNITNHLAPTGFFVGAINSLPDVDEAGHVLHHTVKPKQWWVSLFEEHGLHYSEPYMRYFNGQFIRGPKNTPGSFNFVVSTARGLPSPPAHSLKARLFDTWLGSAPQRYLKRIVAGEL